MERRPDAYTIGNLGRISRASCAQACAVHALAEIDVGEQDVHVGAGQQIAQRFAGVRSGMHLEALVGQRLGHELAEQRLILDQEILAVSCLSLVNAGVALTWVKIRNQTALTAVRGSQLHEELQLGKRRAELILFANRQIG